MPAQAARPTASASTSTATCGAAGAWARPSSTVCVCSMPRASRSAISNCRSAAPTSASAAAIATGCSWRRATRSTPSTSTPRAWPAADRIKQKTMRGIDSSYAWWRLAASVGLSTVGGIGMWSLMVAIPAVQTDFGITRADISFAYTMNTLGFFAGGVIVGRLVDRRGIVVAAVLSAIGVAAGFALAPTTSSLILFAAAQVLIGFSAAVTFAPLVADISHWFQKRRGLAVGIAASGNYIAGAVWPPIVELMIRDHGWRVTYWSVGVLCVAAMMPLALTLRRRAPEHGAAQAASVANQSLAALGLSPNALQALLIVAGLSCCVAMSMPQVHIVAYCADLGYGVARGAQMLSLMLGFGIVSRVATGWLADKVGGAMTLLLGSTLQC